MTMDLDTDPSARFDALFTANQDPWHFKDRWYESRKRAMTLACLPRARYASGFEPGCANGELSAALASRCDRLLISDGSAVAVAIARRRVADLPQVSAVQAWVPDDWPQQRFELIVVSELGYYLGPEALEELVARTARSLLPGGDLVACHWRHPIQGCGLDGDGVHAAISRGIALPRVWSLADPDFRLEVWSADGRSTARREGLV